MRTFALTLILTLALALPAMAQGPSQDGYIQEGPSIVDRTADSGERGDSGGSLPFTGMDLILAAALGLGLFGVGVGMRQLTRPDHQGTASS